MPKLWDLIKTGKMLPGQGYTPEIAAGVGGALTPEEARRKAEEEWMSGLGLLEDYRGGAAGLEEPYSPGTVKALVDREVSRNAAGLQQAQSSARRRAAASGISGGGLDALMADLERDYQRSNIGAERYYQGIAQPANAAFGLQRQQLQWPAVGTEVGARFGRTFASQPGPVGVFPRGFGGGGGTGGVQMGSQTLAPGTQSPYAGRSYPTAEPAAAAPAPQAGATVRGFMTRPPGTRTPALQRRVR